MSSRSWNRVELIGNLTRDPELRYTPSGAAVATFSIATNRTYVSEGERKEEADYHRCVAWNKLAELCQQLLKKGSKVFVSGRLQNRSYEGQDGINRQVTEIVIEDMIVLSAKDALIPDDPNSDIQDSRIPAPDETESPKKDEKETKSKTTSESRQKLTEEPKDQTANQESEDIATDDLPF